MVIYSAHGLYMLKDRLDNVGTDFVLMFMNQKKSGLPLQLFLTTPITAPVTVKIQTPEDLSLVQIDMTLKVYNNNTTNVVIPEILKSELKSEKTYKSILVTSDDVIVLFASNMQFKSTDSCVVYPTDTLSNEYIAVSRESDTPNPAFIGSNIGVVALEVGVVSFYLPTNISVLFDSSTYTGEMHITLNKYEVFHLVTTDVTGILIKANITVAAFSGHSFLKFGDTSGDHMEVMLPPLKSLGRQYMVVKKPSYQHTPELIRVVSTAELTNINISYNSSNYGVELQGMGAYYDFDLPITGALINSDKAILVAQISTSRCIDGVVGDSSMSLAFHPDYLSSEYIFGVPVKQGTNLHQYNLLIIAETKYIMNVLFDNIHLDPLASWVSISNSEFSVAEIEDITEGEHTLSSDGPEAKLAGIVHGIGNGEHFQAAIGRYLGVPRDQINTSKDDNTDRLRQTTSVQRFQDYLPSEPPFHNTTKGSPIMCLALCLEYSACYLLATKPYLGGATDSVICLLYTTVGASGRLRSEHGYTLYRRFA
ncbi:IgGFc-binding protein-like [Pecten maximus]|uniref:IgGFc-binding protein-like n=1 Tax=Pecten maximus TaxID=6579 RepID=UPI001458E441|nr:IgGFc-binding protein-like [Pecten maximus]